MSCQSRWGPGPRSQGASSASVGHRALWLSDGESSWGDWAGLGPKAQTSSGSCSQMAEPEPLPRLGHQTLLQAGGGATVQEGEKVASCIGLASKRGKCFRSAKGGWLEITANSEMFPCKGRASGAMTRWSGWGHSGVPRPKLGTLFSRGCFASRGSSRCEFWGDTLPSPLCFLSVVFCMVLAAGHTGCTIHLNPHCYFGVPQGRTQDMGMKGAGT